MIKGFGSGIGALGLAFAVGEQLPSPGYILCALALGFVAYGLSIYCYIYAQRDLGAAKTSTYYAVAPFVGAALSFLLFWNLPTLSFLVAATIMALGTYLATVDTAGVVTGVAAGTSVITVTTDNGLTAQCTVTVESA